MREVRIAQVSDLHFGRHLPPVADALQESLRDDAPAMVAVCGDLTQTAREGEFRAARAFLDQLPAPVLVVPGNHDLPGWRFWSRFTRPWRRWRRHIETDPHAVLTCTIDGAVAVGINTARQWGMHPDWSRGRVNTRQLNGVLEAIDQAESDVLRIVVAHHPFLLTPPATRRGLVGRSALALQRLHRRVDLLLGGHIHLAYSDVVGGMVVAQSGTAISNRLKGEPNSYNLIDFADDELVIQTKHWDGTAFHTVTIHRYHRRQASHDWQLEGDPA
jgi:3',5'-cyclic AMP phosphodiesterase CpdA